MRYWIIAFALLSSPAWSDTFYTCKEEDGSTRYAIEPCGEISKAVDIEVSRSSKPNRKPGHIYMGMTKDEVIDAWKAPDRKHKSVNESGVSEQWVYRRYRGAQYVYFRDGLVTGWSD